MPRISAFYGIVIYMRWEDEAPHNRPHFHATYAEHSASIAIEPLAVLSGVLPPRALGRVMEWAAMHQDELIENWRRVEEHQPLAPIAPLP